jgi:DNA polymerase-3 subunit delta
VAVRPDQLPAQLQRALAPVYLIAGAEPLLVQECRDQVLQAARQQGFVERSVFDAGPKFDWAQLTEESASRSLFAERRVIDVRLPGGKPGAEGAKALCGVAETGDPDILLLVSSDEWGTAMRKLKWTSTLARLGLLVEIWPLKPAQLPDWIRQRLRRAGLDATPAAVALLSELVEGNLLAAQQEIDKLALLQREGQLDEQDVTRAVGYNARFDAFRLVDSALQGRLDECLRVAGGLQRSGLAIQPVLGAIYRELSIADSVRCAVRDGDSEASAFARLRVWQSRQGCMRQALRRLSAADFGTSFRALALIDRQGKGQAAGDPWLTLDRLLRFICEPAAASPL